MPSHILVAEDQADIRELLVMNLRTAGYQVSAVGDGAQALARQLEMPADLVVLDLMMPRMDGVAFRGAQLAEPRLRGIPVVVLSASEAVGVREQLGVAELHRKPVGMSLLGGILRRQCPPCAVG